MCLLVVFYTPCGHMWYTETWYCAVLVQAVHDKNVRWPWWLRKYEYSFPFSPRPTCFKFLLFMSLLKKQKMNRELLFAQHSVSSFFDEILFFLQSILQRISKAAPLLLAMLGFEDTNTCWVHPSPAGTAGLYHKVLSFLSFYSFLCLVRFKHQNYLGKVVIVVCCRRVVFTVKLRK